MTYSKIWAEKKIHAIYNSCKWEFVKKQPHIDAASTSVQYAQSIIEGMKAYKHHEKIIIYRFEDHYQRLLFSLKRLNFPLIDRDFFFESIKSIIALKNQWENPIKSNVLYMRPIFYGLEGGIFPFASKTCGFSLYAAPIKKSLKENCDIRFYKTVTRTSQNGLNNAKASLNYIPIISKPLDDSLSVDIWYNPLTNYIEEADTANIFFVLKDGIVLTPALNNRILPGITRNSVIRIIKENELFKIEEKNISIEEVKNLCEEGMIHGCFMTSTGIGIQQVNSISFEKKYILEKSDKIAEKFRKEYLNTIYGNDEKYKSWRTIISF